MEISLYAFLPRVHEKVSFLHTEFHFIEKTGEYIGGVFVEYSMKNFNIKIHYSCNEYRPELSFFIYGEDCSYNDFFRLDEFDEKFFDDYNGFGKFKDTVEYDLTYLAVFLKRYLSHLIKNLPEIYNRLRVNGHIGYDGKVHPFEIDKKIKW